MFETIISSVLASVASITILAFLSKTWFEARVRSSIEHEYKKQFELFSRDLDRKDKIELVAHMLAEYMRLPQGETMSRDQRVALNKLSFTSTIWLPTELAKDLSKRLQNKPDAKTPFEIMLMARKELLGDTSLTVEHVTIWDTQLEQRGEPALIRPS